MSIRSYLTLITDFTNSIKNEDFLKEEVVEIIEPKILCEGVDIVTEDEFCAYWEKITPERAETLATIIKEDRDYDAYNLNGMVFVFKSQALAALRSLSKYP